MTSGANSQGREDIVRYEARPTRMFGSYTLCAIYRDGRSQVLSHGTPRHCIAAADKKNRTLAASTDVTNANPKAT